MPRSSVSSGRIWSPVTSEGTGSGRAECSRGFSRSGLGAVQKFMLSRKRGVSCYFGFVLMAQTPWKQTGEVLSLLSRLLLRSFEQREERKEGPGSFRVAPRCPMGNMESLAGSLVFMKGEKWPSEPEIVSSEQRDPCLPAPRAVYYVNTVLCARWKLQPLSNLQQRFKQAGLCSFASVLS